MNTQLMWERLSQANIVSGDLPESTDIAHPWYIRLMLGFAGWLAALFLLGFFVAALGFLFKHNQRGLLVVVGIACSLLAYVIFRSKHNDFLSQFGLALSLCGQIMFAVAIFWSFKPRSDSAFFILATYQIILAVILPNYLHRLLTAGFALTALLIGLNMYGIWGLGTALTAVAVSFIWLKESKWASKFELWEPIAYGLVITLIISQSLLLGKNFLFWSVGKHNNWLYNHALLLASVLISLVLLNVLWVILKENKVVLSSKEAAFTGILAIIFVAISFKIHGLSVGLLVVLLGFMRARKVLMALGLFSLIGFFSWYYYNLNFTLLTKSLILMLLGLGMIASFFFINKIYKKQENVNKLSLAMHTPKGSKILVIATITLLLTAANINISKKENLISTGDTLLFQLAPVDPLSLMQGFYMRINTKIARQIQSALYEKNQNNTIKISDGFVIVEKGDNNVVNYVSLYENQELKPNQYKIPFKMRKGRIQFTTDAYYFQEGKAQHYNKATHGEYRYKDGEMLLVNLIDENFKVL